MLRLSPITQRAAKAFVNLHHRHHRAPRGALFQVAVEDGGGRVVGVAIVGRPVARALQDGRTAEVVRVCSDGEWENVCSMLYGACRRAAKALGYDRLYTYTLADESGASLRASNWLKDGETEGGEWDTPSRRRTAATFPTTPKTRWIIHL